MNTKKSCKYFTFTFCALTIVASVVVLLYFFVFRSSESKLPEGPKIVIDHDAGADDAMAIFMAVLSEKYLDGPQIVGITTCNGNVDESQAFENTQRILHVANRRDIPIYRGSTKSIVSTFPSDGYFGNDGLGDAENVHFTPTPAQPHHAAFALIELSKKYEGELIITAIGPQTNIAMAIRLDPGFLNRLAHLYVGAGHIYSELDPSPEFNALVDVEAYYIVAEQATTNKVTFVPYSSIVMSLNISKEWRQDVLGAIPTEIMKNLNIFEQVSMGSDDPSWAMLDPAVMAVALKDNLVTEYKYSEHSIILCDSQRGINTNVWTSPEEANARLVYTVNEEQYKTFLLGVFSSELMNNGILNRK